MMSGAYWRTALFVQVVLLGIAQRSEQFMRLSACLQRYIRGTGRALAARVEEHLAREMVNCLLVHLGNTEFTRIARTTRLGPDT